MTTNLLVQHTEENQAETDIDNNEEPTVAKDKAEAAHKTEALHAASKTNGGGQQPNNGERKYDSKHTPKSGKGGALYSNKNPRSDNARQGHYSK